MNKKVLDLNTLSQTSVSKINLLETEPQRKITKRRAGACVEKRRSSRVFDVEQASGIKTNECAVRKQAAVEVVSYSQRIQSIIPDGGPEQNYIPDAASSFEEQEEPRASCVDKQVLQDNISRISNIISSRLDVSEDENCRMRNSALSDYVDQNTAHLQTLDDDNAADTCAHVACLSMYLSADLEAPENSPKAEYTANLVAFEAIPLRKKQFSAQFLFNSMKPGQPIASADFPASQDSSDIFDNCEPVFNEQVATPIVYVAQRPEEPYKRVAQGFLAFTSGRIDQLSRKTRSVAEKSSSGNGVCLHELGENQAELCKLTSVVRDLFDELYVHEPIFNRKVTSEHSEVMMEKRLVDRCGSPVPEMPSFVELQPFLNTNVDLESFLFPKEEIAVYGEVHGKMCDILKTGGVGCAWKTDGRNVNINVVSGIHALLTLSQLKRINLAASSATHLYFNCPQSIDIFVSTLVPIERLDARRCRSLRQLLVDGVCSDDAVHLHEIKYQIRERNLATFVITE